MVLSLEFPLFRRVPNALEAFLFSLSQMTNVTFLHPCVFFCEQVLGSLNQRKLPLPLPTQSKRGTDTSIVLGECAVVEVPEEGLS